MEWLKELLKKLGLDESKLDGAVSDIGKELPKHFIPKDKFNEAVEGKKKAEQDVVDRDKQLEELKKNSGDAEALKAQITKLQSDNDTAKKKYDDEMKDLRLNTALKLALSSDSHDPDLVAGLLDKSKIELDDNGNVKAGLNDQIKDLRGNKPFLFKEAQKGPKFKGVTPPNGGDTNFSASPDLTKLQEDYKKAVESKNMPLQIALKNQMFELEKGQGDQ